MTIHNGGMLVRLLCCVFFLFLSWRAHGDPGYSERLNLRPLTTSSLLAEFQFWSNDTLQSYSQQHFRYIPRSLGQILQHTSTQELHLRFSSGRWDDESWGVRPRNGTREGGTGVELWAWMEADSEEESFARWTTLNQALSGLFCASLNFIDSTRTTRPKISFEPTGHAASVPSDRLYLLHGTLPREVVCTENLTPFLKLLPCKGRAGIASLLDGHKVFDASWQTMAIDFRSVCSRDGSPCAIEIEQTIDMVLDTERAKRPRDNPIPRPVGKEALLCDETKPYHNEETCFPSDLSRGQSWTVAELFGRSMKQPCLSADAAGNPRESLCLYVPNDRNVYPSEGTIERRNNDTSERCYILPETMGFNMVLSHLGPQTFNNLTTPPMYASRSITGHGQERGGVQSRLTNPNPTQAISFVYFESLPWFMKPYLHTLVARLSNSSTPSPDLIKEIYYRPALDRHRGTQLELVMTVPADSTVMLTYDFDKAILRYTEYPPDANRGFDVAPAVIRILPNPDDRVKRGGKHESQYIRTTSLLLPLPTPDFSMPYNVIILTSTVMALAFGSIFNFLVRRFVAADEVEGWDVKPLKERVRSRIQFVRTRVMERLGNGGKDNSAKEVKKNQ